ncbi:hypothetical protein SVAN01_09364 [Stagonosporopsis vannaccii]|nr:hypothetical protein SVAN01_09364 [Stagonosporopsis vannaccii]
MDSLERALHDPVWDRLADGHASYLAHPGQRGDQVIRKQFEVVTVAMRNMSSKRIDRLDQHRQRYCLEAFTAIYKARKSINRIRYMISSDNRQKASKKEVCRLSGEHYNLLWMLQPKHALIYTAMFDLLWATTQLAKDVDSLRTHRSYCPPSSPIALRNPQGECLTDLPRWTNSVPRVLVEYWYREEVAKQNWECVLATRKEDWEKRTGKTCPDEERMTFTELVQSYPVKSVVNDATKTIRFLERRSQKLLSSAQDAWTILKRYFDRFKFMRLFDTYNHQRWQCSGWQELQQRELAADIEHDQRMYGLGEEERSEFWGAYLLNRTDMELEGNLRQPEVVAQVFEMLLNATFSNGC